MPIFHTGVKISKYMIIAICISFAIPLNAQIRNKEYAEQIDADSVRQEFDRGPTSLCTKIIISFLALQ